MTNTNTATASFTVTHARYLASKIAADLRQMKLFYNQPSDKQIEDYISEVIVLLLGGHLASVTYGFKRGDDWVIALRYTAEQSGILINDDKSGRVTPGVDVSNAYWYSFLIYSNSYSNLSSLEREKLEAQLPFKRSGADEPKISGLWTNDKSYSNGGVSIQRGTFNRS